MKIKARHFSWFLFISIALAAALPAVAQEDTAGGEAYTVKEGDTLWDISASKLENPYHWPDIWKKNPDIKDPDVIYPGEKIVLPGGQAAQKGAAEGVKSGGAGVQEEAPAYQAKDSVTGHAPFVERGKTIEKARPSGPKLINLGGAETKIPVATANEILAAGYISDDLKGVKKITGDNLGGRDIYSMGDKLYTDVKGVSVGDLFIIGRITRRVSDPANRRYLGKLVDPSGSLKIIEKVDGKMVGMVENSFTAIKADDILIPCAKPQLTYEPVQPNPGLSGKFGYVAAVMDNKDTGSQQDIVYLDMGSDMGVKPGDHFVIRRSGDDKPALIDGDGYVSPRSYDLPDHVVGEVVVISVQPKSSTAKVAVFKEIVLPGYRAVYKD